MILEEKVKSNLTEGQVFTNFRKLCECLETDYSNQPNIKKRIIRKMNQYFEFEKISNTNKIVITRIFDKRQISYSTKGGKYPAIYAPVLLENLEKEEYVTCSELAVRINAVNKTVAQFRSDYETQNEIKKEFIFKKGKDPNSKFILSRKFNELCYFMNYTGNQCTNRILSTLGNLKRNGEITYEKGYIIYYDEEFTKRLLGHALKLELEEIKEITLPSTYEELALFIDEFKNFPGFKTSVQYYIMKIFTEKPNKRMATKSEEQDIKEIETSVAQEFGYENKQSLLKKTQWDISVRNQYFRKLKSKLSHYGIYAFHGFHITKVKYNEIGDIKKPLADINQIFCVMLMDSYEKHEKKLLQKDIESALQKQDGLGDWESRYQAMQSERCEARIERYKAFIHHYAMH